MINPYGGLPERIMVEEPIPMMLWCPSCGRRHIDNPGMDAHHTHACQFCGLLWRPALCRTTGVQFLPGCKDPASASLAEMVTNPKAGT